MTQDSEERFLNGQYKPCKVAETWEEHREEMENAMRKIGLLEEHTQHLEPIANTLTEVKDGLLKAVLGREIVPVGVTQSMLQNQKESYELMLKGQRESYVSIIKTLAWSFSGVVVTLVGLKIAMPNLF